MPKVLVSTPLGLDERITEVFKRWGFQSKADFFRHAAIVYLNEMDKIQSVNKGRFTKVSPFGNFMA